MSSCGLIIGGETVAVVAGRHGQDIRRYLPCIARRQVRRAGRDEAMAAGRLPEEGEPRLGSVMLPAGRRVLAEQGSGVPVAWVTRQVIPEAGRVWSVLSDLREQTGLVPVLLGDPPGEDSGGLFFDSFFHSPADVTELDHLDAAEVLAGWWDGSLPSEEEEQYDTRPPAVREHAPFGSRFPGLAPGEDGKLSMARLREVLGSLPPARVGLVAASRPADVLPLVGWSGPDWLPGALPIAAVLRSWEARFGARLLSVGPGAEIRLLAERPPRNSETAQRLAAEHFAFCDECGGQGLRYVSAITASLVNAPIWTFWWD